MLMTNSMTITQFTKHLPAYPGEQNAAGQGDSHNGEKLCGDRGKADSHQRGRTDSSQDGCAALGWRQPSRRHANDNRIIARQNDIDHQNLKKRHEPIGHAVSSYPAIYYLMDNFLEMYLQDE